MILALSFAVASGSLIVMGGGPEPEAAIKRIIERAGGPGAKVVILAFPHEAVEPSAKKLTTFFAGLGAKNTVAPTSLDSKIVAEALSGAKGVFISGGNQFLFLKRFPEESGVPAAIRKVYNEGGVVAGTSAGASLLSEWMPGAKSTDQTELKPLAEGTEKGIACLPNTLFDQHFLKRNRVTRMLQNLLSRPGSWGLGVDERAWCEIRGGKVTAEQGQTVILTCSEAGSGFQLKLLKPSESAPVPSKAPSRAETLGR